MLINKRYIILLLLIITSFRFSEAQKLINSPYSRFGPGVIEQQGILKSRSMGGAGIALRDPVSINYLNPASYTAIDTISFVFDLGIEYQANILSDPQYSSYYSDDINFHHLSFAFPITRWMGFAAGIVPYSNGYYNLQKKVLETDSEYNPIIGEFENSHKGAGSYNEFFAGIGLSPLKNLSLGVNFTYLFGNIERDNLYLFTDDNNQFNNLTAENIRLYGYNLSYGVQYSINLKNDYFASLGFTYSMKKEYNSEYNKLFTRYAPYSGFYSIDTLSYTSIEDGMAELPQEMGAGISFGKKNLFLFSADYTMSNWGEVSFMGYDDYLVNSTSIRLGAEFIPDINANYNYFNRVEYRLGGHISDSHLMVNGEQLKEFGITFGAGLPMNRSKSKVNLHIEYLNRKGSAENGLHSENCLTVGISLNLHDYWFLKQKYK